MSKSNGVVSLSALKAACEDCSLAELCLPRGLNSEELSQLENIVKRSSPLKRGGHLFDMGDPMESLYAVRSGSIKVSACTENGDEQVLGFVLPGELLGFDGIETGRHGCAALALETTTTCQVPFHRLESLCRTMNGLQQHMNRMLGREISNDHALLLLLAKKNAHERLAAFILSLSDRYQERGYSPTEFNLSMSRQDIGNYLGLAFETVSRLFAHFQDEGLLTVHRRRVQIHDIVALRNLASGRDADRHEHQST